PLFSVLLFGTLVSPTQLSAQVNQGNHSISVKAQYGIDGDSGDVNRRDNYLYGLHLSFNKDLSGSKRDWVRIFNAKNVSYGLTWHNLDHMIDRVNGVDYPGGQAFGV